MSEKNNLNENENTITVVNENGDEKQYEILLTFTNEDNNRSYVFYYDEVDADESGNIQTLVSRYDETNSELFELEEDELAIVEEVFNTFVDEQGLEEDE
ncbi:MAG: DUF1292 domain-containing protein [Bacilli bacterium]|jgi:uncharacterized protein YrzB (UPF0473 family)|nr:DUF1292 domain-containing protein [Bacilli bacterium]